MNDQPQAKPSRRWHRVRRGLLVAGVGAVALHLGAGLWTAHRLNQATQALIEAERPMDATAVIPKACPASENGATALLWAAHLAAEERLPVSDLPPSLRAVANRELSDTTLMSADEISKIADRSYLAAHGEELSPLLDEPRLRPTWDAVDTALRYPNAVFEVPWRNGISIELPHLQRIRTVARLESLRIHLLARRGHPQEASRRLATLLTGTIARGLQQEPALISGLTFASTQWLGLGSLKLWLEGGGIPDRTVAEALATTCSVPALIDREIVDGERLLTESSWEDPDRRTSALLYQSHADQEGGWMDRSLDRGLFLLYNSALGYPLRNHDRAIYLESLMSYHLAVSHGRAPQVDVDDLPRSAFLSRVFLPNLTSMHMTSRRCDQLWRLARTAVALVHYRQRTGTWPTTLPDLGFDTGADLTWTARGQGGVLIATPLTNKPHDNHLAWLTWTLTDPAQQGPAGTATPGR